MQVIKVRIVFLILKNSQALPFLCLLNILRFLRKKRRTKKKCYSCILLVDIPTTRLPGKLAPQRFGGKLWRKVKDKQLLVERNLDFVCTSAQVQYVQQWWESQHLLSLEFPNALFLVHLNPERNRNMMNKYVFSQGSFFFFFGLHIHIYRIRVFNNK